MWVSCGDVCMESREAAEGRAQLDPPTCSVYKSLLPFLKLLEGK